MEGGPLLTTEGFPSPYRSRYPSRQSSSSWVNIIGTTNFRLSQHWQNPQPQKLLPMGFKKNLAPTCTTTTFCSSNYEAIPPSHIITASELFPKLLHFLFLFLSCNTSYVFLRTIFNEAIRLNKDLVSMYFTIFLFFSCSFLTYGLCAITFFFSFSFLVPTT